MTDNRFSSPGVDARFPSPGTDARWPTPTDDREHLADGTDTRFEGSSYGGGSGDTDPPLLDGTHDLLVGTDSAGVGYYLGAFGDLTPPTLESATVDFLQVNSTGTMVMEFAGGVQVNGSTWIDIQVSDRNPSRLTWNPSFLDYRASGYVHVWEFLNAHIGDTVPINITPENGGGGPLSATYVLGAAPNTAVITTTGGTPPFNFWTIDTDEIDYENIPNPYTHTFTGPGTFACEVVEAIPSEPQYYEFDVTIP